MKPYDVLIIGGGVTGTAIARELSQYSLRIALLEKETEPAFGISKSNSGIVHPGTQNPPHSLKGKLCVQGNRLLRDLARDLGVHFRETGELIVCFREEEKAELLRLKKEAEELGVPGLELVGPEWLREHEPNLNPDAVAALYAPTAGIISPYRLVYDLAENAVKNGLDLFTSRRVTGIEFQTRPFRIRTAEGQDFYARYIVNAAGLFADEIAGMVQVQDFVIRPRKGEEFILDNKLTGLTRHLLFPLPTPASKGVLMIITSDGNPMIGPTAQDVDDKYDLATTESGLQQVLSRVRHLVPAVDGDRIIAYFAGLRAVAGHDFIIRHEAGVPGFIQAAGIQSPGLTASPAIARLVCGLLEQNGLRLTRKRIFHRHRRPSTHLFAIPLAKTQKLVRQDSAYADMVCRCEMVSAREIRDAVRRGAKTMDGIKFRTRAQAGRCHGGFCTTRIMKILAEELGRPMPEITKRGPGTELVMGSRESGPACNPEDLGASPPADPGRALLPVALPRPRGAKAANRHDLVVVGGGPAGMAAALAAAGEGVQDILLLERDQYLGGILNQCIHPGFGLHHFHEELTGPEYADRFLTRVQAEPRIRVSLRSLVVRLTPDKVLTYFKPGALETVAARALILATGCRERTREMIHIPGTRPAGIYPAGLAQKLMNLEGLLPGREVVIVGSGDIGLIMARRLALEGAKVKAVIEIRRESRGLLRNVVQCLEDFDIPLYLSHKVACIHGRDRVEKVTVAAVEDNGREVPGSQFEIPCDTILISVGLIPENELLEMAGAQMDKKTNQAVAAEVNRTSLPGIFVCGNACKVYDLADWVTRDSLLAGKMAADYLRGLA